MKKLIMLLSLCCLLGIQETFASHSMGGEIYLNQISGSQYRVHFRFWRFIAGIPAPTVFPISIKSLTSSIPESNINVYLDSSKVISPNYAEEYFYSGTFSFISLSDLYLIKTFVCCRNANILNLGGASSASLMFAVYTEFKPTVGGSLNSSPRFLLPPEPFALLNQPYIHGPFAFDPDGDSLSFRLDTTKTLLNGNLSNIQPFTYLYQVSNSSYSYDQTTGTFSWLPNMLGAFELTYVVDEWRNGIKIGSVSRDVQISVVNNSINTTPPSIVLNGSGFSGFTTPTFQIQAGSPFTLNLDITDPDPTTKSLLFTGPMFQGASSALANTTTTSTGISAVINWTPPLSMISPVPYQMHIKYHEVTPLYTFSRDIPVMLQVSSIVAGLEQSEVDDIAFDAFLNEAGHVQVNFTLLEASDLSIYAYDVQGRSLGVLVEGRFESGQHQSVHHQLTGYQGMMILRAQDHQGWQKTIKLIGR